MKMDQESLAKNRFWICYGILLPLILVVMLLLVNNRDLLGDRHVNGRILNAISMVVIAALILLTGALVVSSFLR